jgi:hypothetical protein
MSTRFNAIDGTKIVTINILRRSESGVVIRRGRIAIILGSGGHIARPAEAFSTFKRT